MPAPAPFRNSSVQNWFDQLDEQVCHICLEPFDSSHIALTVPGCRHVFGRACLRAWVFSGNHGHNTCPQCRGTLFEQGIPLIEDGNVNDLLVDDRPQYRGLPLLDYEEAERDDDDGDDRSLARGTYGSSSSSRAGNPPLPNRQQPTQARSTTEIPESWPRPSEVDREIETRIRNAIRPNQTSLPRTIPRRPVLRPATLPPRQPALQPTQRIIPRRPLSPRQPASQSSSFFPPLTPARVPGAFSTPVLDSLPRPVVIQIPRPVPVPVPSSSSSSGSRLGPEESPKPPRRDWVKMLGGVRSRPKL